MGEVCVMDNYEVLDFEKEQYELETQQRELDKKRNEIIDKRILNTEKRISTIERNQKNIFDVLEKEKAKNIIRDKEYKDTKETVDGFDILSHPKYRVEFNELKKSVHSRILFLFNNNKSSCEYILFKNFYSRWIYSDLNDLVGAGSSACIYMGNDKEKYKAYLVCIKEWRPDKRDINDARNTYKKKYDKHNHGGLSSEIVSSWEEYLEKTNGGLN